jgi:ATP-binding cassette subfamily B protein
VRSLWSIWKRPPDEEAVEPQAADTGSGAGGRAMSLGVGEREDWITEQVSESAWALWRALPRVGPYLRPYRRLLVVSSLTSVAAAALLLAEPWPLALILDSVLGKHDPPGFVTVFLGSDPGIYLLLGVAVGARFGIVLLSNAVNVLSDWLNARVEQNMVLDFRSRLFEHVQGLSLTFHDQRLTGQLMARINLQASALGSIVMAFPPMLEATLTLVGMLVITALIDWQLALLAMAVVPLLFYSFGLYGTKIVPRVRTVQRLEWQSLSIVHEAVGMLRVIRSFGREDHEHRKFVNQGRTAVDERVKLTVQQNLYTLGVQTITALGTSAVLGFGAWHVIRGDITVGELIVLLSYIASVYKPLEQISATIGDLHTQFVYFNASLMLLDTEPEVKEAPDAVELERARGHVDVEHLGFQYKRRRGTLNDISFEALPGERIAIVGPTGAGKTTLMSLLIRFYDPKRGRILIDGIDIRKVKLRALREQISVVLQEPLLFSGTIGDNIRYGKLDASMDEVTEAADAANAHDFISQLPKGYETPIGERGADVSGGERQRICVARAFLKDAPILVLDEPTSSIDSRTENVILDALDELMLGRTSFLVAHRLSTVRNADKILVLNRGRLVEQGVHDELMAQRGLYYELHEAQKRERRRREAAVQDAIRTGEPLPSPEAAPERAPEVPAERDDALAGASADGEGRVVWREVPEPRGTNPSATRPARGRRKRSGRAAR